MMSEPTAAATAAVEAPAGEPIRGTLRLADGVEAGSGLVFVTVRAGGGPPLAVARMNVGSFPMAFTVGPENMMMQGRPWAGEFTVAARLDRDGNASTQSPDDLVGQIVGPVEPGATGLEIVLQRSDR